MASDDDIERLLREVEALESGGSKAQPPVPAQGREPAKQEAPSESGGGRVGWSLIAAAGGGAAGFIIGTLLGFLPLVDGLSTALGAALGAALAALISGPPGWYGK